MTTKLTATQAKARILALLDEAAAGQEFEITKHGRIVARLVPAQGARSMRGSLAGLAMTAGSEEDLFSTTATWELE
jgi:prevent-host-death family protein